MKTRVSKTLICSLIIIFTCAAVPVSAYAKFNYDPGFLEELSKKSAEASERIRANQDLIDGIRDRIDNLPKHVTSKDRTEVENIRMLLIRLQQIAGDEQTAINVVGKQYVEKLEDAERHLNNPTFEDRLREYGIDIEENPGFAIALAIGIGAWYLLYIIQFFLGYGIAYRTTKAKGDSGVSLFGWLIVYETAAIIPFLGIYLWNRSKRLPAAEN